MYLQENAAKWWQTYKMSHPAVTRKYFIADIQETFGSDDYRSALNELLDLKQTSTVEEYTTQFKSLQYDVSMHGCQYDASMHGCQYDALSLPLSMSEDFEMTSGLQLSLKFELLWREQLTLQRFSRKLRTDKSLNTKTRISQLRLPLPSRKLGQQITMAICGETNN